MGLSVIIENLKEFLKFFPKVHIKDVAEIIIIAFAIYKLIKWVRNSRAWILFRGIVILIIISIIAMIFELNTILWIFAKTINVGLIAIFIVFQPELRRALEQLGRGEIFNNLFLNEGDSDIGILTEEKIKEIIAALKDMAEVKMGALIVIERTISLKDYEKTGIAIDGLISKELLVNIFEHNTPLHDGAVIIRGNRIVSATSYLPLSENMSISKELGTRHRAAIGISEVTDAIALIVSEETGNISVALTGNLVRGVDEEYLINKLNYLFVEKKKHDKKFFFWKGTKDNDK